MKYSFLSGFFNGDGSMGNNIYIGKLTEKIGNLPKLLSDLGFEYKIRNDKNYLKYEYIYFKKNLNNLFLFTKLNLIIRKRRQLNQHIIKKGGLENGN